MAVPDFQTLMLPVLHVLADGAEYRIRDVSHTVIQWLNLNESDQKEMLPSGRQTRLSNRLAWARIYLERAGLFEKTERGMLRITQRGSDVLQDNPERITIRYLSQFPEFNQFRAASKEQTHITRDTEQTPEEVLEAGYQNLRRALASELLDRLKICSPSFFEEIVIDLLVAMGYGGSRMDAGQAVGKSGDDGIDGIIKEDKLGLDAIYIQAKRWSDKVGRPIVQAFAGSLEGQRARKGILITTSSFTQDAQEYVNRIEKKIVLLDGDTLAHLMIEHDIGVTARATYIVKKIDEDYFSDEG
jgi:restriction system protein